MRRSLIPSLLVAGLLLAACTTATATDSKSAPKQGAFPVTIDNAGAKVHLASRPHRILSLSASATQMLYDLGAGHQVVGVDKYSTYPPNAPRTKFTGYESSAEDYLPLRPDLVVLAYDTGSLVSQLNKLSIPVLVLGPASSLAGTKRQMLELGEATGHVAGAEKANAKMTADLERTVRAAHHRGKSATYYIELSTSFYTATSRTFIGALFSRFGMKDIADAASGASSGYPRLSAEYILRSNPDYVFLADTVCCHQTAASFASRPGFSILKAVKDHHVVGVNDSVASQWGPHSLETFLSLIARVLGDSKTGTSH